MEVKSLTDGMSLPASSAEAIWFVGCGNMAGAMVEGWRLAGTDLSRSVAIRPSGRPVEGLRTVRTLGEAGRQPDIVVLGFKPQMLDEVAPEVARWITADCVVVSILAGVEAASLRERFPRAAAIVRAMPNIAVAVRRGVVPLYSADGSDELRERMLRLFAPLGYVAWCASEAEFGAIGSVSGAGPAYIARYIAALAMAGETRGLDPAVALTVARETVFGAGWLAATTGESMDEIVRRVRSPNGTTEAGLKVLDAELPDLIERTLAAAGRRSAELAAAARGIASEPSPS